MRPERQRALMTLLALVGLASAALAALYLAVGTDSLKVHHCNVPGFQINDTFSSACARAESHLGATELVVVMVPGVAALGCLCALLLPDTRRNAVMLVATAVLVASLFGSQWGYVFLPALAFDIGALLIAFKFNPLKWFWENVSWRFRTNHPEM